MWKIPQTSRATCYRPDMPRNSKRNDTVHMYICMYSMRLLTYVYYTSYVCFWACSGSHASLIGRLALLLLFVLPNCEDCDPKSCLCTYQYSEQILKPEQPEKWTLVEIKKKVSKSVSYQELYCSMTCTESSLIWEIGIKLSWRMCRTFVLCHFRMLYKFTSMTK